MKKLKLLDTFAGIGGFSYAAEKLVGGFKTVQFIEIDSYCQKILNKNFPNIPIHNDITTYTAKPYSADIICGGFPCQDISIAGRGKGITEETRSGLFYELIRVIRMVRPKYVILENVAAILTNGLDIVLGELSKAGYNAEWSVISASSLGACHRRSRWWLIAYPNERSCSSQEQCSTFNRSNEGIRLDNENLRGTKQVITDLIGLHSRSQSKIQTGGDSSSGSVGSRDVTDSESERLERENKTRLQGKRLRSDSPRCGGSTPDTKGSKGNEYETDQGDGKTRTQKVSRNRDSSQNPHIWRSTEHRLNPNWRQYVSEPCLRRGDDGLSDRTHRLKALGNSVVPQVAAIPLQRVLDIENSKNK